MISVPTIVARGIVREGLSTSPAGTVADSMPRKAKSVSDAAPAIAANVDEYCGGTVGAKLFQLVHNNPIVPTATNGINLRIVVIVCSLPAPCTPRKLTHVNNHTTPTATSPPSAGFVFKAGMSPLV